MLAKCIGNWYVTKQLATTGEVVWIWNWGKNVNYEGINRASFPWTVIISMRRKIWLTSSSLP